MPERVSCSNCGALTALDDAFCPNCGRPIRSNVAVDASKSTAADAEAKARGVPEQQRLPQLPEVVSGFLYAEYDSRKLTVLTGYAAGLIGFPIGLHRLYAGKHLWWLYLILFILGAIGSFLLVGFVFFGVMFIWWVVDMALMKGWVEEHNSALRRQIFGWGRTSGERYPYTDWQTQASWHSGASTNRGNR